MTRSSAAPPPSRLAAQSLAHAHQTPSSVHRYHKLKASTFYNGRLEPRYVTIPSVINYYWFFVTTRCIKKIKNRNFIKYFSLLNDKNGLHCCRLTFERYAIATWFERQIMYVEKLSTMVGLTSGLRYQLPVETPSLPRILYVFRFRKKTRKLFVQCNLRPMV